MDAATHTVWIPIENVTGSANYGATDCSTLSTARASATIPMRAAGITIATTDGTTTLGELLGKTTSTSGWQVGFAFSADIAR